ncbi:hypothetical protein GOZ68_26080 [Vibrio parahaemolyticus]|nr:hypothetical protein [Vibrio parahaemolyticus]
MTQWLAPTGHGDALQNISDAGVPFLKKFCTPQLEGFHEWSDYKPMMLERAELLSFHCWGIFEEMRNIVLQEEYDSGNLSTKVDDPKLGLSIIERIIDKDYKFINVGDIDLSSYS